MTAKGDRGRWKQHAVFWALMMATFWAITLLFRWRNPDYDITIAIMVSVMYTALNAVWIAIIISRSPRS